MTSGMKTIIYPVRDLAAAKAIYTTLLGVEPFADEPYYVGYMVGDLQLGLDPGGHNSGSNAPITYWEGDDINAALHGLVAAGAEVQQAVTEVGPGKMIASVKDADGNVTGITQSP